MTHDNDNDNDHELGAWRAEWNTLGGREDLAAELVARAAKDGSRMRRAAVAEVLGAVFSSSICVWMVVRSHASLEITAMTAVILLFNGGWLTHFFTLRARLFGAAGEGLAPFIDLTRQRLATELRWARLARRWMMALAAPLLPWAAWVLAAHRGAYLAAPWRAVVGFGGAAAIFGGVWVWTLRRETRLRGESELFERHLADAHVA
ncbi:MAG: hypothetical protein JWP97_1126 [Labilithrix sp.]|nr:hypothetical protein [Labilithrix sp.]